MEEKTEKNKEVFWKAVFWIVTIILVIICFMLLKKIETNKQDRIFAINEKTNEKVKEEVIEYLHEKYYQYENYAKITNIQLIKKSYAPSCIGPDFNVRQYIFEYNTDTFPEGFYVTALQDKKTGEIKSIYEYKGVVINGAGTGYDPAEDTIPLRKKMEITKEEELLVKCFKENNIKTYDLDFETYYTRDTIWWNITIPINYENEYKEQKFFDTKLNKDLWDLYTNQDVEIYKIYFNDMEIDFRQYNKAN